MLAAMSLEQFFRRYAEVSLGRQPEELAGFYAPTFIVGGPQGSRAFANDVRFGEWLRQVSASNRQHGMRALLVNGVREEALSPLHALATVTWGAQFEKTGSRVIEFDISYLLERTDDEWRILSYISRTDQQEEMTKAGLL